MKLDLFLDSSSRRRGKDSVCESDEPKSTSHVTASDVGRLSRPLGIAVATAVLLGCSPSGSPTAVTAAVEQDESGGSTTTDAPPPATSSTSEDSPPGRCQRDDGSFASDGSTRGTGDQRVKCEQGEWIPYPAQTTTSTTVAVADGVVTNLFLIGELEQESRDPAITEFREALADFIVLLGYERVDVVGGSAPDEDGLILFISATSGYRSEVNQLDATVDLVSQLALNFWGPDFFGATTESGNGAVALRLVSDGREFLITGDKMIRINQRFLSSRDALGI